MSTKNTHSSARYTVRIYTKLACALGLLLSISLPTANAVEVLSSQELAAHCALLNKDPEGADGQYCVRYIQGFIDGAIATDARVMLSAENAISGNETFEQRAMRTRMPGRDDLSRAAKLAGFCLGDHLPLRDVVEVIVADLAASVSSTTADEPAMEAVYKSLMRNYPCDQ